MTGRRPPRQPQAPPGATCQFKSFTPLPIRRQYSHTQSSRPTHQRPVHRQQCCFQPMYLASDSGRNRKPDRVTCVGQSSGFGTIAGLNRQVVGNLQHAQQTTGRHTHTHAVCVWHKGRRGWEGEVGQRLDSSSGGAQKPAAACHITALPCVHVPTCTHPACCRQPAPTATKSQSTAATAACTHVHKMRPLTCRALSPGYWLTAAAGRAAS